MKKNILFILILTLFLPINNKLYSQTPETRNPPTIRDHKDSNRFKYKKYSPKTVERIKTVLKVKKNENTKIDKDQKLNKIIEKLDKFGKKYGIKFYVKPFHASDYAKKYSTWSYIKTEKDIKNLERYSKIFIEEWSKYPVEWVKKSNLKGVALVKKLNVVKQYRAAMPDAYGEVLYYDVEYGKYGDTYERSTIHHEYYHMIEENYFGSFYYKDPVWAKFNDKKFKYGTGGATAYDENDFVNTQHPQKGFVDNYSRYGLEEDKAQIYAFIFTTKRYKQLKKWLKNDPILRKKVNYMKKFIKSKCSEMDKQYFISIHKK